MINYLEPIYLIYIFLFVFGLCGMLASRNLIRKIFAMSIMQTSVILFFVSLAYKVKATVPIIHDHLHHNNNSELYVNPLPHALMLTAIVVSVSTIGVALSLVFSIYKTWDSLEEDTVLERMMD